jgi:predicted MFS family arabinose efflux permease
VLVQESCLPTSPSDSIHTQPGHPARLALTLAISPIVSIGIGRFAYALVLPDMRDSLHWSYSAAGFMNTMNAAGYLVGALIASRIIRRYGSSLVVRGGTLAALASLALCGLTENFAALSVARLIAGIGAAAAFVAGGALATRIAQSRPHQASFIMSLFYAGPPLGIIASGLSAPFVLQIGGPGSWWMVWWVLAAVGAVLTIPLLLTPISQNAPIHDPTTPKFSLRPMAMYLASYFVYGMGYIAYMTFMIAYVRDLGGGAAAQAAFWCLIGLAGFAASWVWRRVLAWDRGGWPTAIILVVNAIGSALPTLGHSTTMLALSAILFGLAFSTVTASTSVFVRLNVPPSAWPGAIAALTIAVGVGQTLGPFAVGAITDALGSLSYALNISAATLLVAAIMAATQGKLKKPS